MNQDLIYREPEDLNLYKSNNELFPFLNFENNLSYNFDNYSCSENDNNLYVMSDKITQRDLKLKTFNESNDVNNFEDTRIISTEKSNNILNNNKNKRGRKTHLEKNLLLNNTSRSKYAKDNIIRKIKTHFINNFLLNLINVLIVEKLSKDYYFIRKLRNEISKDITIKYNIYLFNQKLEQLYSSEISIQFRSIIHKSQNKKIINQLKKEDFFSNFLNLKVKDIYNIYISKNCKNILKDKFNIEDKSNKIISFYEFIKKFEVQDKEYFNLLKNTGENLLNYFTINKARKYKKKKRYKY